MAGQLSDTERKSAHGKTSITGDFKIDRLRIYTPARGNNSFIEMGEGGGASWSEINFYEDIDSSVVHGDISIQDAVGIIEGIPLIGEEFIEVRMATAGATPTPISSPNNNTPPTPEEAEKFLFHYFRVYKIDPPQKINDNFRVIKLHFISDIMFTNMQVKVQKSYPTKDKKRIYESSEDSTPYTIADMVREMFVECFIGKRKPDWHQPTTYNLLVEPTLGVYSACIPDWTPFKAMNFLASRAISINQKSNGANFKFYQTMKGFRFISLETLFQGGFRGYKRTDESDYIQKFPHYKQFPTEDVANRAKTSWVPVYGDTFTDVLGIPGDQPYVATYTYKPANIGERDSASEKFAVTEFNLVSSVDSMKNLGMGMYANKVITHNITQMKYESFDFNYIDGEELERWRESNPKPNFKSIATEVEEIPIIPEKDKTKSKTDQSFHSDPGKLCSNNADMLGSAETYISVYPTNKDVAIRFAKGPTVSTFQREDGTRVFGIEESTSSVHGKKSDQPSDEYDKKVEEWLAQRTSQRLQTQSVKINFTVPGDSSREVGDLIWFQYPSENSELTEGSGTVEPHKYFSGKYLVTALRHKITKEEYTMVVEAMKDGYRSQISSGFELTNPRVQSPDGMGTVDMTTMTGGGSYR